MPSARPVKTIKKRVKRPAGNKYPKGMYFDWNNRLRRSQGEPACEQCALGGIIKLASYGYIQFLPMVCGPHKKDKMKDVVAPECRCGRRALYGVLVAKGEKKILTHCSTCKDDSQVNNSTSKCISCNQKYRIFNYEGLPKRYCGDCRDEDMVDVVSPRCACGTMAAFGLKGGRPVCCSDCRTAEMINVNCLLCPCGKYAIIGYPGQSPQWCAPCRPSGTIIFPLRKCTECLALNQKLEPAIFGVNAPERCATHKIAGDMNLVEHKCKICGLMGVVNAEGVCGDHDPELHRRIKFRKQKEVRQYLDVYESDIPYTSFDRVIPEIRRNCRIAERPDVFWDCDSKHVMLEVDEEQHAQSACDFTRMCVFASASQLPTFFVRYNPDAYKAQKQIKTYDRLRHLGSVVRDVLDRMPVEGALLSVCYLFYDGYDGSPTWESYSFEEVRARLDAYRPE